MKVDKKLLPWLLIASSGVIALVTYHRQASIEQATKQTSAGQLVQSVTATKTIKPAIETVSSSYQCDNQQTIQAIYSDTSIEPLSVILNINGQRYTLYSVPSQAGNLYATEQGINPGQAMRWHVQGLEARLVGMTPDYTAKSHPVAGYSVENYSLKNHSLKNHPVENPLVEEVSTAAGQTGEDIRIINNQTLQNHTAGSDDINHDPEDEQLTHHYTVERYNTASDKAQLLMRCQQPI